MPLVPAGSFDPVAVPRHVVQQRFRTPKKSIPQSTVERNHILQAVRHYVAEFNPGARKGQKVLVKGVLGRLATGDRINVTFMATVSANCGT